MRHDDTFAAAIKFVAGAALVATLLLLWGIFAPPSSAQTGLCMERTKFVDHLEETEDIEKPAWIGLQEARANGVPIRLYVELWLGEDFWSLITGAEGGEQVCLISTGSEWALMPSAPAPPLPGQPVEEGD